MAGKTFLQECHFCLHSDCCDGTNHIAARLQMAFAGHYHADADMELLEILAIITTAVN